jgi:hypothetical protein
MLPKVGQRCRRQLRQPVHPVQAQQPAGAADYFHISADLGFDPASEQLIGPPLLSTGAARDGG